jgi:predicted transcriptional regulator
MKQRSSFSIVSLILETVAKSEPTGITKTRIMQNVMLNYKRANRYCYQMMESALISFKPESRTFHITEKGRLVLHNCLELAQYISPINQLINKYRYGDETSSNYYYSYSSSPEDFQTDKAATSANTIK